VNGFSKRVLNLTNLACDSLEGRKYDVRLGNCFKLLSITNCKLNLVDTFPVFLITKFIIF